MTHHAISLSTLNTRIGNALESSFPEPVWVVAEIHEMNLNRNGHCYLELVEKSSTDDHLVAKARGTIWSFRFTTIRAYFETVTGTVLNRGIKVLLRVEVSFHELYGLSLNIIDIDPSYTLGDMAMRKKEVLARLQAAGVMEMNKELNLSRVPQQIAVISSETAAGYGDFIDSLVHNNYGFGFYVSLFPAIVQGEAAGSSIIQALEQVYSKGIDYDAVVLIRGGGSQSDLECFNGYELALNIAQFPIPVITGIGHDRDETIADLVAHRSLKTPTAVAEFLVDRLLDFSEKLSRMEERITQVTQWIIQQERLSLNQLSTDLGHLARRMIADEKYHAGNLGRSFNSAVKHAIQGHAGSLGALSTKIRYLLKALFSEKKREIESLNDLSRRNVKEHISHQGEHLKNLERSLALLRPENILARGFSITYADGKALRSVTSIMEGMSIQTLLSDGSLESDIKKITHTDKSE